MIANPEKEIRRSIENTLNNWSNSQSVRIAWDGVAFSPADEELYVAERVIIRDTRPSGIGAATTTPGQMVFDCTLVLQVISPVGYGLNEALEIASSLRNEFSFRYFTPLPDLSLDFWQFGRITAINIEDNFLSITLEQDFRATTPV